LGKIFIDLLRGGKLDSGRIGRKRAVSDALDPQLLVTGEKKLSPYRRSRQAGQVSVRCPFATILTARCEAFVFSIDTGLPVRDFLYLAFVRAKYYALIFGIQSGTASVSTERRVTKLIGAHCNGALTQCSL